MTISIKVKYIKTDSWKNELYELKKVSALLGKWTQNRIDLCTSYLSVWIYKLIFQSLRSLKGVLGHGAPQN